MHKEEEMQPLQLVIRFSNDCALHTAQNETIVCITPKLYLVAVGRT